MPLKRAEHSSDWSMARFFALIAMELDLVNPLLRLRAVSLRVADSPGS